MTDLILANDNNLPVSPNDLTTLFGLWSRSRAEFLNWILTRKGVSTEQVRLNTRNAYEIALRQFFDGIWPKVHEEHEADMLARGEYVEAVWPEIMPWTVTATTARQFKDILAVRGKVVRGTVTLANGKTVRSEVGRTGLAESSINIKLASLKSYYDFLVSLFEIPYRPQYNSLIEAGAMFPDETGRKVLLWGPTWRNPFDPKAVAPYTVDERPKFLTADEVRAILAEIDPNSPMGARDLAIILTIWSTACRVSEVLNLRWGDLQPKVNGNVLFHFRGKSGKMEDVELQLDVYQVIVKYLKLAGRFGGIGPDSPLFTAIDSDRILRIDRIREKYPDGVPEKSISYQTALQALRKYASRAKIDPSKVHFRALRHSRARRTAMAMEERHGMADIVSLNKLLRHSSLDMTRHYTDLFKEAEDPWADDAIAAVMPGERIRSPKDLEIAQLRARLAELEAS